MKQIAHLLIIVLFLGACSSGPKKAEVSTLPPKPKNAIQFLGKPVVLLISLDGFRADYVKKFSPPHLKKFIKEGASAENLISTYPSQTFPNHYSLITGLTAEHHGLMGNHFYDRSLDKEYHIHSPSVMEGFWYGGLPLWVAASRQGMVTASCFWVGSEAEIAGGRPHYFLPFDDRFPHVSRIEKIAEWLSWPDEERPRFMTLYFSTVDVTGHKFGPDSPELKKAVLDLDQDLGLLFAKIDESRVPVNVVIVSDHGMQTIDPIKNGIRLDPLVSEEDFRIFGGGPQMYFYARSPEKIKPAYEKLKKAQNHFKVYLRDEIPERYRFKKNPRTPDLLVDAELPYSLGMAKQFAKAHRGGTHGYDPLEKNMRGIFYARGPQIQSGKKIASFENVNVYPFLLQLLELKTLEPIDGKPEVLAPILKVDP